MNSSPTDTITPALNSSQPWGFDSVRANSAPTHWTLVMCLALLGAMMLHSTGCQEHRSLENESNSSPAEPPADTAPLDATAQTDAANAPPKGSLEPTSEPDATDTNGADEGSEPTTPATSDCDTPGSYCDRTKTFGLADFVSYGRGIAAADVDGDGWTDIFAVDTDHPSTHPEKWGRSMLFRNLEGKGFEPIEVGISDAHLQGAWSASFADYDNDGDPDLLITAGGYTAPSSLSLYENKMDTESLFVDVSDNLGLEASQRVDKPFWGSSWADYDSDGLLDVIVTQLKGRPYLFHNLGQGQFEEVSIAAGVFGPDFTDAKNPLWVDFDHDGDFDLYLSGQEVEGFYWNEDGVFTGMPGPFSEAPEGPAVFASLVEDFDQDGYDDIYFGRWSCQDYIFFGGPGGYFTELGPGIGLDAAIDCGDEQEPSEHIENTMGLAAIDLFDDGYPDIYIGTGSPQSSAPDIVYCNLGDRRFERCTQILFAADDDHLMTRGHGVTRGDFDHDGDGDLFFNLGGHPNNDRMSGEDSREPNRLFLFDSGSAASSAVITLEGTVSNRDAVGARVTALGERTSYYAVRSSQGFQSQNSAEIIIPCGQLERLEVTVDWPSGIRSTHFVSRGERSILVEPN